MSETIIITGSSGFIGSALVNELSQTHTVVGIDLEGPPYPPEDAEWIFANLESDESVQQAFHLIKQRYGHEIKSVIHLAAYYDFSGEASDKYETVNVEGTERIMRELKNFDVGQIIYSSTMLVHAPCQPGKPITEDSPLQPKWDYPKSKLKTESVFSKLHGDVPLVILRVSGVYDNYCHSIPLAQQLARINEKQLLSHVFPGDITHGQSFMHLDDLIYLINLALDEADELPLETVLLVGEDRTFSYDQLQREFGRLLHGDDDWTTREVPKSVAKAGAWIQDALPGEEPFIKPWMIDLADDHYEIDIGRAHSLLNWRPQRYLIDCVSRMVQSLNEDPAAWYKAHHIAPPVWLRHQKAA